MYQLSRLILIVAVILFAYCFALAAFLAIQQQVPPDKQNLVWAVLIVSVIAVLARKKMRRIFTVFGTAAWASYAELVGAGMIRAETGLILGRIKRDGAPIVCAAQALSNKCLSAKAACHEFADNLHPWKRKKGALVRLPHTVHTMVVAPTGVGKNVSCIVPFLMTCEESCVVVDFKGENALLTAERRRRMGHNTVILAPFMVTTQKMRRRADTFNPLDFIDKDSPQALDECRDLAESLVIRTGEEKDPHWNDSAEAVIAAIIAVVMIYGQMDKGTRSLQKVRDILAHPQEFAMAKKLMQEHGGMLARWGGQLEHLKGDELASVMSTCNRHLRFLDTPAIAESTGSSSFDPAALRKQKMTVYLVLPPEHMRAQSPLLRMWIGSMFRAVVKGGLQERQKVHFILDEAAALGHMPALDDAVDKYRGFGVRLQFYYQSLGQLKKCWPHDQGQTLLSNTSQVVFGCNDFPTAEFISKTLGNETVVVESGGASSQWSKNHGSSRGSGYSESSGSTYSGGNSSNWQQQTRELLKPDEVMQLDPRIAITLTPGVRPICTRLIRYYEEKALLKRRGWLIRLTAAGRTLLLSATLLFCAAALALALTRQVGAIIRPHQIIPMAPVINQPPKRVHPARVAPKSIRPNVDSPLRPKHFRDRRKRNDTTRARTERAALRRPATKHGARPELGQIQKRPGQRVRPPGRSRSARAGGRPVQRQWLRDVPARRQGKRAGTGSDARQSGRAAGNARRAT